MSDLIDKYSKAREGENKSEVKDNTYNTDHDNHVISHLTLRKAIGFLAFGLPVILIFGSVSKHHDLLSSLSDYYHSVMKIAFTGVLLVISTFFWTFIGEREIETNLNKAAAFFAILVAFIPTKNEFKILKHGETYTFEQLTSFQCYSIAHADIMGIIHLIAAGMFFIVLIIMVFFVFLPRERVSMKPKKWKTLWYNISGWGMIGSISLILIFELFNLEFKYSTFFLETLALWLFGLAWIIKGWDEDGLIKPTT